MNKNITSTETEKQKVSRFVLFRWTVGQILQPHDLAAIEAAQQRLFRQITAASTAGKARSERKTQAARENARLGGGPNNPNGRRGKEKK